MLVLPASPSVCCSLLRYLIRVGAEGVGGAEGLGIVRFFTILNVFVGKQVCSGKPRNKKGEDSRSDCSLAQLGAVEKRTQKQTLMYLVCNLQF